MSVPGLFSLPEAATEPAGLKLYLGLVPLEAIALYPVLESVTVTVSRKQAGVATIVLSAMRDEHGSWPVLDGGWFTRWNPVRIAADFGLYQEDVLWGYVLKITPEFPADRGAAKVTVEIQDETIALDREQITRDWNSEGGSQTLSDGLIVQSVAAGQRLTVDPTGGQGQTTVPLTQDKTDFRFLTELAEKSGYEFRVQFGQVYFGPMSLSGEPQPELLVYAGPDTSVREFKIEEEAAVPQEAVIASVDAAGSGGGSVMRLQPDLPILGRDAAGSEGQSGLSPFAWTVRQEGDVKPDAGRILAQAKINEASMSIKAEALVDSTLYGHVVSPGRTISVDGIGERYGGRFYVDTVEHVFDAAGYTQKLSLLKNGLNEG